MESRLKKYAKRLQNLLGKPGFWIVSALLALAPNIASADLFDVAFGTIAKIAFGITWIISVIFGVLIMVEGYLLQIILALNMGIVNSPVVRVGFPVALSFANLAFVLGIIVIAIATILNIQSYGIKSILWKLLVMAIAINFGLIIAGSILRVADNLTLFFVQSTLPGQVQKDASANLASFASTFAAAFNPQKAMLLNPEDANNQKEIADFQAAFNNAGQVASAAIIKPIISIFLSICVSLIMLIVLGGLIVMFLYRYLVLALLLVGLPLAWAAWPFPNLKKHFSSWWDKFLKQVFFAPIVIFFLWLSVTVAHEMGNAGSALAQHINTIKGTSDGFWAGVAGFIGGLMAPVVDSFVSAIIVGGIMVAGIIAAEKFGATFSKNTLAMVKEGGKGVQKRVMNRVGNRARRVGERATASLAGAGAGVLRTMRPLAGLANKPVFGTAPRKSRILLDNEGKAIQREVGFDAAGNKGLQQEVAFDMSGNKFINWRKNDRGEYLDSSGKKIDAIGTMNAYVSANGKILNDKDIIGTYKAPVTEGGQILSDDILGANGMPRKTVKIDGKITAWVDREGRPVNAPGIEGAISGLTTARAVGKGAAERMREQAEFEKGFVSDIFSGFKEGVSKGFKGSSSHDKALKNLKDALKAMEEGHAHEEPAGGGGDHPPAH